MSRSEFKIFLYLNKHKFQTVIVQIRHLVCQLDMTRSHLKKIENFFLKSLLVFVTQISQTIGDMHTRDFVLKNVVQLHAYNFYSFWRGNCGNLKLVINITL